MWAELRGPGSSLVCTRLSCDLRRSCPQPGLWTQTHEVGEEPRWQHRTSARDGPRDLRPLEGADAWQGGVKLHFFLVRGQRS